MRAVQERRQREERDWPDSVCLSVWCVKKVVWREDDTTTGSMRQFGGRGGGVMRGKREMKWPLKPELKLLRQVHKTYTYNQLMGLVIK